jgi:hypothetical protein
VESGESSASAGDPKPPSCAEDGHVWKEDPKRKGQSADDAAQAQDAKAAELSSKPSRAGEMRGAAFEAKAIRDNKEKLPVERCGVVYVCSVCGKEQEVDIAGGGRVAEAKSRKTKQVKSRSAQCKRLKSIQAQHYDKSKKPLAKLDGSLSDVNESKAIYERRGFSTEVVG